MNVAIVACLSVANLNTFFRISLDQSRTANCRLSNWRGSVCGYLGDLQLVGLRVTDSADVACHSMSASHTKADLLPINIDGTGAHPTLLCVQQQIAELKQSLPHHR